MFKFFPKMSDKVIWVDEKDNVLGEIPRAQAHSDGLLHRIAVVYVTSSDGKILVQERMDTGFLDHSSAGHVNPGESYLEAAKRELCEELGICNVELKEIAESVSDEKHPAGRRIWHKYKIYEYQGEPVKLCKEEVKGVFWADPLEIYDKMKSDPGDKVYTGGFKDSLGVFLKAKKLILPMQT